jgi:hypothetical protein
MSGINERDLPASLTLEEAFNAAYFMIQIYGGVESWRSEDIVLLHHYMETDPARWSDWKKAVGLALANPTAATEYLHGK